MLEARKQLLATREKGCAVHSSIITVYKRKALSEFFLSFLCIFK